MSKMVMSRLSRHCDSFESGGGNVEIRLEPFWRLPLGESRKQCYRLRWTPRFGTFWFSDTMSRSCEFGDDSSFDPHKNTLSTRLRPFRRGSLRIATVHEP